MILGLIGGVGSGKSTVTKILQEEYGFKLLLTDGIAKQLELPGGSCYEAMVKALGEDILSDGYGSRIDNPRLAARIYADPEALETVNNIVHPAVWRYVSDYIDRCSSEGRQHIAVETALPDASFRKMCDEIWFIYTEREIRIKRLISDRGYTLEKSESIISRQLSDEEFRAYADVVIDNSGERTAAEEAVRKRLSHF